ncbi:actin-binding protein [Ophiostoma piceae UAMH 11346]|uniref:Coronin n=1 Tax=Ophiostoma piceae (strain UAMH 11346) TaxID=1262450 RepID=S3C9F8_OPHP1|nr:actin-binding protein [Ophiostoma piceae UAMH 11346]
MAGRFVRASKYRHVFGKPTRKEFCYDNLHISRNAWDTNLVKANPEFLSINWEASGGGAFAVIPLEERGKLPDQIPLFRGHTAAVLDTDWHPFNDHVIASASDDGRVFIWQVPDNFTLHTDAEEIVDIAPVSKLQGHSRKVGQVLFNPAADSILASASGDLTVKVWDVTTGQAAATLRQPDIIQSLSWNASGNLLVTTSRDKRIRVWDVRQGSTVHEAQGHPGAKNSRVVWLGEHNRFATTGFSRMSERQLALWEPGRNEPIGGFNTLDSISGVLMPFWDEGSNCLYLAGKGDGNIRYYEYENDKFEFLSEYKSADPQRGIAFLPRRGVNLHENEIMRAFKTVNDAYIEPIAFTVPRRAETFQSDIYPPATGTKPAVSAKEWVSGKTGVPVKIDLESVYEGNAPVEVASDYKPAATPTTSAPAPAPASPIKESPPPKKEPEPTPAPVRTGPPPKISDQKESLSTMANKFQDDEVESSDDDDETSSFEEVGRPQPRQAPAAVVTKPAASAYKAPQQASSPPPVAKTPTLPAVSRTVAPVSPVPQSPAASAPSSGGGDIADALAKLTTLVQVQNSKIDSLTGEVEGLKKRLLLSSEQSERIRQLELELEEARS